LQNEEQAEKRKPRQRRRKAARGGEVQVEYELNFLSLSVFQPVGSIPLVDDWRALLDGYVDDLNDLDDSAVTPRECNSDVDAASKDGEHTEGQLLNDGFMTDAGDSETDHSESTIRSE